jgi:predicted  nucleic acid-binding Zn-ribbon protein
MLRVRQLTETLEMPVDPGITSWLDGFATEAAKVNEALVSLRSEGWADLSGYLEMTPGWAEAVASQSSEAMLNILRNISGGSRQTRAEIERIQNEIYELSSGMTIRPPGGGDAATAEAKKSWQEWFGEITKIDPERFGSSGAKAAELYLAEFSRSLGAGKTVSAALGEEFNIAEALRGQQADIQKTLVELLSINPDDIDDPFKIYSRSIEPLAAQFRRLGEEINAAEYAKQIKDLQKKIDDFGKSEADLAYDAAKANGALVEQADKIKSLMNECTRTEIIDDYRRRIEELTVSQRDLAIAAFEAAGGVGDELEEFKRLYDQLERLNSGFISLEQKISDSLYSAMEHMKKFKAESAVAIADLAAQFASLNISASLNGFEEFGRAMGEGKNAAESMRNALTAMSLEILNALPNLFLQAGLQLIAQGQWPLGLGFIAAAGSTALIKGYVGGRVEAEQSAARNAHGNIFGETGIQAFARGGSFTNQIVSGPTLFKFARGTGLMGEAGPEAVMPLRRMANGDLGVRSEGGGANVTVNIINNSGAEVKQEEYEDGDGNKQYDIYIGEMINRHLASGKADRVMGGRYNIRAAGV